MYSFKFTKTKVTHIDWIITKCFCYRKKSWKCSYMLYNRIIEKLDKYELEGVMAHELSHIKNYDILLSTVVSVFVGLIVMLADIF